MNFHSYVIPYSHLKPPVDTQMQFSQGGSQTYSFLLCGFSPPAPFSSHPNLGKKPQHLLGEPAATLLESQGKKIKFKGSGNKQSLKASFLSQLHGHKLATSCKVLELPALQLAFQLFRTFSHPAPPALALQESMGKFSRCQAGTTFTPASQRPLGHCLGSL